MNNRAAKKDYFPIILTVSLILSVILAVISYSINISFDEQTYSSLKSLFFKPLGIWIYPVIGASMFSIFFRSPSGKVGKFLLILADIMVLYLISTFVATSYSYFSFQLFPFSDIIKPLLEGVGADTVSLNKTSPEGIPTIIWVMFVGVVMSFILRYPLGKIFSAFSKAICQVSLNIFLIVISIFGKKYQQSFDSDTDYSLLMVNFIDKIIFNILIAILMMAPIAVYASFLQILNSQGFVFFKTLGHFILCYAAILFLYQFVVMPLIRSILCFGVKNGETYISFLKKAIPVIATAGTTASSVATIASNIKAAQSLNVPEDMKNKGHNRALIPIGATFNMDGTSISLIVYFLLAAELSGINVSFWWVTLTAVGLSAGTAAVPSASLIMLISMYNAFSIPAAITGKLLSIIMAVDPIHDRIRTIVNVWGDLNMTYIVQSKRGLITTLSKLLKLKNSTN